MRSRHDGSSRARNVRRSERSRRIATARLVDALGLLPQSRNRKMFDELSHGSGHRGMHHFPAGRPLADLWYDDVRRSRGGRTDRAHELRHVAARHTSDRLQPLDEEGNGIRIGVCAELHLDLAERRNVITVRRGCRHADPIVNELGDERGVLTHEPRGETIGGQSRRRGHWFGPGQRCDETEGGVRRLLTIGREVHLVADERNIISRHRKFDDPSGVVAVANGAAPTGQAEVGGVVVDGAQISTALLDAGRTGDGGGEVADLHRRVDLELELTFALDAHARTPLEPERSITQT